MANLKSTLCWCCANAVPSLTTGCSWSMYLEPVEGWRADERALPCGDAYKSSYTVHWCPEYQREDRENETGR